MGFNKVATGIIDQFNDNGNFKIIDYGKPSLTFYKSSGDKTYKLQDCQFKETEDELIKELFARMTAKENIISMNNIAYKMEQGKLFSRECVQEYVETQEHRSVNKLFEQIKAGAASSTINIRNGFKELTYQNDAKGFYLRYEDGIRKPELSCGTWLSVKQRDENGLPETIFCTGKGRKEYHLKPNQDSTWKDELRLDFSPNKSEITYCEILERSRHNDYRKCQELPIEKTEEHIKRFLANDLKDPNFIDDAIKYQNGWVYAQNAIAAVGAIGAACSIFQLVKNVVDLKTEKRSDGFTYFVESDEEKSKQIKTFGWFVASLALTFGSICFYATIPPIES